MREFLISVAAAFLAMLFLTIVLGFTFSVMALSLEIFGSYGVILGLGASFFLLMIGAIWADINGNV